MNEPQTLFDAIPATSPTDAIGKSTADERAAFTVEETARMLGLSRHATYDAINRGEIPSVKFGRLIRVPRAALENLLAGNGGAQ